MTSGQELQVLNSVVKRISVDMMDNFLSGQGSSDVLLHDVAMLKNLSPIRHNEPSTVVNPTFRIGTFLACITGNCLCSMLGGLFISFVRQGLASFWLRHPYLMPIRLTKQGEVVS